MECITETVGPAGSQSNRWNLRGPRRGPYHPIWATWDCSPQWIPARRAGNPRFLKIKSLSMIQTPCANRKTSKLLKRDPDGLKPATSTSDRAFPDAMHIALHLSQHHTHLQQVAVG